MTESTVSLIITVRAGEASETIEKAISIMDIESDLDQAFLIGQQEVTAMLLDLLEAQLHAYISRHTDWKNLGTDRRDQGESYDSTPPPTPSS